MWLIQHNKKVLVGFAVLTLLSSYYALQITFRHEVDSFLPRDNEEIVYYHQFRENLEPDDNFLLIAVQNEPSVFSQPFLEAMDSFRVSCAQLPMVEKATCLTNLYYPLKTPFGVVRLPYIHINEPDKYEADSARILGAPILKGRFVSGDASTLTVVITTKDNLTQQEAKSLMDTLHQVVQAQPFAHVHIAGKSRTQTEFVAMIEQEVKLYVLLSTFFVIGIVFFLFRSWWAVFVVYSSVLGGMIIFFGLLGVIGRPLDLMSSLFPTLMLVVGTSDVIHIFSKYVDELKKGASKPAAMKTTIREVGLATLMTSLTTAVGFASLYSSPIDPIRYFGLTAALGVFVAYLSVITYTTSLLTLLNINHLIKLRVSQSYWTTWMTFVYNLARRRDNMVFGIAMGIVLVSIYGLSRISTNTYLLSDIPDDDGMVTDFRFF